MAMITSERIRLQAGSLEVTVGEADFPLAQLCGFASRQNPRRGFLFVSKVLARHIPTRPQILRHVHERLATKLPHDLPGPVVFIGCAETATSLGQGVFEAYIARTGRQDCVFVHSTRYRLNSEIAFQFVEEHSHATEHIVYYPTHSPTRELFSSATSLVLVDDELTTGKTLLNLAGAFSSQVTCVREAAFVCITDWRNNRDPVEVGGIEVKFYSLLSGNYRFERDSSFTVPPMPDVRGSNENKDFLLASNYGRLGMCAPVNLPESVVSQFDDVTEGPVLVLGSGEFCHPALVAAELLESRGVEAWCQSTTRSPVLVGNAIESVISFTDNYGDLISNFLYNAGAFSYSRVLLCVETPMHLIPENLIERTGARVIQFLCLPH